MPAKTRLLKEKEAATDLGVSRQFLRQGRMRTNAYRSFGAPPFIKVGARGIRYDINDLDKWIDSCRQGASGGVA